MTFSDFDPSTKQIFWGNVFLVGCCVFYLAWWLLAFRPVGAIKGMRSGWLLIPAVAAGLAAVILTLRGISGAARQTALFPGHCIIWGGIAAYVILLLITLFLLKRPVTTELFLIVGWAMLALSEINALYGSGLFSHETSVVFVIVIVAATVLSLVSYVLYYNLSSTAGYITGMVPLVLMALVMASVSIRMTV